MIEKFVTCSSEVGVVYSAGRRFYEDLNETRDVILPVHTGWIAEHLICEGNFVYPVTPMFRREVFERIRLNEEFVAEGEAVHMRIALHFKYDYIEDVTAVMRDHSDNIGKNSELLYEEIRRYFEWYFGLPDVPDSIRALKDEVLFRNSATKAMQLIVDSRNFPAGRRVAMDAFRRRPFAVTRIKLLAAFLISLLPAPVACRALDQIKAQRRTG